ncbi:hypothetical protein [Lapillicoccus sp.]|uniref:hypothetical protein n=1 Tax=Lapillicoccus sp. TaxID=1909287 RepID=UPI00326338D2
MSMPVPQDGDGTGCSRRWAVTSPSPHESWGDPAQAWSNERVLYADASRRTLASAAAVEGFFAFVWFGWGQEGPPPGVPSVLGAGAVLAVLVVVGGVLAARRARNQPSPVDGAAAGKRFGIVVGVEFALVGLGAAILGFTSHPEFIAAWTCLVVGVHFLPLARLFVGIGMAPLAGAVSVVGVAAFVVGATTTVLPSTVAGLGAGACLLGHSASMLLARHPAAG